MKQELLDFNLNNGDLCKITLIELNHKNYAINCVIHLQEPNLDPSLFQDIVDFVLSKNTDIKNLFFDSLRFKYGILGFNLYGHCRASFKNKLRTPIPTEHLISGKSNYKWILPDFLPKFDPDIKQLVKHIEKKPHNFMKIFHKGKINDIPYLIDLNNYTVKYNHYFEMHPTELRPSFTIYIHINDVYYKKDDITKNDIIHLDYLLIEKFKSFNILLLINRP
jgi:hypothetical protein